MEKYPYLRSINVDYIDELFEKYLADPDSVDTSWRYFFDGIDFGQENGEYTNGHSPSNGTAATPATSPSGDILNEARAYQLILAYRERGKLFANLDPLTAASTTQIDPKEFGISEADLNRVFGITKTLGFGDQPLKGVIELLKQAYCKSVASEVFHLENEIEKKWLFEKIEKSPLSNAPDSETRKFIFNRLLASESFERFLHTRYVAQKRFSVEGGEGVVPMLDSFFENGAELGATEFVIGMAHRGRLNVLTNIMGKKPEYIFTEFEGTYHVDTTLGEGDVKYHMGYSTDIKTRAGKPVHLSLGSNPSHLEFINPVIEGATRAKQTFSGDKERTRTIPIQIHGDAAFAGQGVCFETLNLSQLEGYKTGGTLHIVINNQVGFTTSPHDSRSTRYCTDLAKMLDSPIFHVNGDDGDAIWNVAKLAIEYRQKFKKDVFIDLVCYRKHGHNEGDEPSFTQPLLYKKIKAHASPRESFQAKLVQSQVLTAEAAQALVDKENERLTAAQQITKKEAPHPPVSVFTGRWQGLKRPSEEDLFKTAKTAVSKTTLLEIAQKINTIPTGFNLHSKLSRFFDARLKAITDGKGIDWGNAETLAYASLVYEGTSVRLSGQDAERGTFTHRHAVLNDFETAQKYTPINQLSNEAKLHVHNSHLSETGVMGFEYGYSLADPLALTIWEAQFGDFANGAQVIIDQFLCSGESKWQRMSGLVLLLPHSFEGQGPEHSSARLERFLQLCGKNNIFVVNLSTPAQIFHALRRQVRRDFRKPLVVMSPKSLLRHPLAVSDLTHLTDGSFEEVLDDSTVKSPAKIKKVLLCSGKVYYDLLAARTEKNLEDTALVRLEQFYPWPGQKLAKILERYSGVKEFTWVQEEPRNMGAWTFVNNYWSGGYASFKDQVGGRGIQYVGREICAAPAVGSLKLHEKEQKALIEQALSR